MKRDLFKELISWKEAPSRKPLLIRGARQVGKSWLVRKLGESFDNFVEINFEENREIETFFADNLDPDSLLFHLSNYLGVPITPGKTLLFFDEIQVCPRALLSLRYFHEKMPNLHVIAAGSLVEFGLKDLSFPVGRLQYLYLHPLSFGEFLQAVGKEALRELLMKQQGQGLPEPIHSQLMEHVRDYLVVGGLPEVVQCFADSRDIPRCQKIQTSILETYRSDFGKYVRRSQVKYVRLLFDSLCLQLGKKFQYAHVSHDVRSRELSEALDLLEMAGIVHKVYHSNANGVPLDSESNHKKFKVLFFDSGLANRIAGLEIKDLFKDPDISAIHKGMLAELFVGLEIAAYTSPLERPRLYYWHREEPSSNAEVDYVIVKGSEIVPVEVKSGTRGRLYSLKRFLSEKNKTYGLRIGNSPYSEEGDLCFVPFYAIEALLKN